MPMRIRPIKKSNRTNLDADAVSGANVPVNSYISSMDA